MKATSRLLSTLVWTLDSASDGDENALVPSRTEYTHILSWNYRKKLVRAGVVGVGSGIFSKFLKIRENFVKISGKMYGDTKMGKEHYITANLFLIKALHDNNPEIIRSSPVEYLRNDNLHLIVGLFPTTFIYIYSCTPVYIYLYI